MDVVMMSVAAWFIGAQHKIERAPAITKQAVKENIILLASRNVSVNRTF